METCPSFSQFLQDAAVLSQRQAEKLSPSLANHDEDQSIFKLADFFRTLTPSDCYDLALRLHLLWKKACETPPVEKKETPVTVENTSDQTQKKKVFKNFKSVSHFPEKYDTNLSESETKSITNYASPTRGNLFNYLHSESQRKNYTKLENEQRKLENELKGCSFQPNSSKYQSSSRSSSQVFDRLQQDLRKEKDEINQSKRLEIEMRDCTFTPTLVTKRLTTEEESMYSSVPSLNQTFDRLYKDHRVKKHLSIENELKKQELEVKGCTFQPALSSRTRSPLNQSRSQADYTDRFNQLYKLHSERQRSLMKKRIEKSEEEEKKHSFKPAIKASPARRSTSKGVQERLLEWNEKKNQKLELKLQEKMQSEKSMNRELNLPARRESDVTSPQANPQAFERLYQDSEMKKVRKEMLEKKVLKDVGASFTPKTNLSRNTSAKKQKENMGGNFFGGAHDVSMSRDEDRILKQKSPAQRNLDKQADDQKAWNNALYRKHFLDDIQNNFAEQDIGKTATFGYH